MRKAGGADMVALDLEADSMFHYKEQVCLIQMAANGNTAVIDPLSVTDLSELGSILADKNICKVLHGADYDVRSLYRDFGITINNLFDTQLASTFLGCKETGLESVVAKRFGVELNKKYQKKDWSQRPLPGEMMAYAASDVVFLIPLARTLMKELAGMGRLDWVREECALLSRVRPQDGNSGPKFLKIKGAGRLNPRQLACLENILELRDAAARQKNRPLFKVISNTAMLKIASAMPSSLKALRNLSTLSDRQIDMYGKSIVASVKAARKQPENELPAYPRKKSPRLSPKVPTRVKTIRTWRDKLARKLDLDPALLLNRSLIRDIAIVKPDSRETLAAIDGLHQWQVDSFGDQIVRLLNKPKNA